MHLSIRRPLTALALILCSLGVATSALAQTTPVTIAWNSPAADATLAGTVQLRLTGQAFRNVEIFRDGRMLARAAIAADGRSATASIDSRTFTDGAITLTAHAWNSAPGASFTSDADAGARRFTVRNAAPPPPASPPTQVTLRWAQPAQNAQVSGIVAFRLIGQAFRNVEIFRNGAMLSRAQVSSDATTATASIDTKQFPNGAVMLTAHGWNSTPGQPFSSDADAGQLILNVNNAASPPPPPPPPSGTWKSGTDGLSRDFLKQFGDWRGRPVTSTWINLHWLESSWITNPGLMSDLNGTRVLVWDYYKDFNGILVLSMSMAGNSNVDRATYENNMRSCANGQLNSMWETFGRNAKAKGRNGTNTVVSLAHEFNGTWFKWNPGTVGLDVWKNCWKNVYRSIKVGSDVKVIWVFSSTNNTQKGGDFAVNTAWDAYPGDDFVDVIGINRYDFRSLGSMSSTNWRDLCANTQDICYTAQFARDHGKPLGLPEWSIERGEFGYGDNPAFIQKMVTFFKDNSDVLLFENLFENGGSGDWHVFPREDDNKNSSDKYRELY
jgi:hypothetical protein